MLSAERVGPIQGKVIAALPNETGEETGETGNITEPRRTPEGLAPNTDWSPGDPALRTSEIRYRRLFEAARDGILILDAATLEITDVNPFMTELLGYSRDEFLGKELWQIGFFSDKEASQAAFRELQAKGFIRYEDLPLQTIEGSLRQVEFVSNVYEEDSHQVIQCNIRDITDRKRAEEERGLLLESAQEARAEADAANSIKDEFLATLSHELRTPLTAILGWAQLLNEGRLDERVSLRAIQTIERNACAQRQLIDDLLDISRIITGKLRLDLRPVELTPTIEAVVEGLRPAADARNIHLQITLDARVSPVSGDPDRIQQIIWNLLSNAIKFTPEGGHVQVRLECLDSADSSSLDPRRDRAQHMRAGAEAGQQPACRPGSHIEITISDTGQGIAPELLLHVFDRFRQADSSITRRHGGLGLGLSIVRQLVELHGGTVTAESPGEGAGTTFKVILPVRSVPQAASNEAKTPPIIVSSPPTDGQPTLNGLRVLVVDDELDSREFVAAVLTGRGAEVVSFGSPIQALEEIERQAFDVIVADIGMAEMDGYSLIKKIRHLPPEHGGGIPAAALTAYAGVEDRRRVLSAGYQMHIPKPVEPAELATVVGSLARRHAVPVAI